MTPYILVWSPSSRRMALLCNESNGNQDATMVMATQTKFGRLQLLTSDLAGHGNLSYRYLHEALMLLFFREP